MGQRSPRMNKTGKTAKGSRRAAAFPLADKGRQSGSKASKRAKVVTTPKMPEAAAGDFGLTDGRTLHLREFRQSAIYQGLIEGFPTKEMNEKIIDSLVREAQREGDVRPYLIKPVERLLDHNYPFGTPAALPKIGCVARFESDEPARNPGMDYSSLVVVWFQEKFGLPTDGALIDAIREIDWAAAAQDHEI